MKKGRLINKLLTSLLCISLLSTTITGMFSEVGAEEVPDYGTYEDGITKENPSDLNNVYVNFEDFPDNFTEGLRYWGGSEDRVGKASDYADVKDGVLTVHYNTAQGEDGATLAKPYDGIQSVRLRLPDSLKGKQVGFIMEFEQSTNMSARVYASDGRVKSYTYNYTSNNLGIYQTCVTIETTEADEYVYFMLNLMSAPEDAASTEYSVYYFTIGYVNEQGIFTDLNGNLYNTGYRYNTPYYGTEEDGIFVRKGDTLFRQNLVGTDVFNGDFSQGLKYWAPYDIPDDTYTSDTADVIDGELVFTAADDGDSYYKVVSAGINIPREWVDKKIGVAFDMDSTVAGMQVHVLDASGGNMKGAGISARPAERTIVWTDYTVQESDSKIHVRIQQDNGSEATRGAVSKVDDFVLFAYDNQEQDEPGIALNGEPVNLDYANGYYLYGSETEGIYNKDWNSCVVKQTPIGEMNNLDFSEGLKYWSGRYDRQKTYASDFASVENGVLKITSTGNYDGLVSYPVLIPDEWRDKDLYLLVRTRSDNPSSSLQVRVRAIEDVDHNRGVSNTAIARNQPELVPEFIPISFEETDTAFFIWMEMGDIAGASGYIDDIEFVYGLGEGHYVTMDGEHINSDTMPYYGTEEDGIFIRENAMHDGMAKISAIDTYMNFDFSEGLKYWGPRYGQWGYASEHATVEDGVLKVTDENYQYEGLRSVKFRLPERAINQQIIFSCDIQSNVSVGYKLFGNVTETSDWINITQGTGDEWQHIVITSENSKLSADDTEMAIEIQMWGSEDKTKYYNIDNIEICIADEGGIDGLFSDLYGAPVGYEYGDVNADAVVDVRDLIRLKKYLADENEVNVYHAAANADKSSDLAIGATDLAALKNQLIVS